MKKSQHDIIKQRLKESPLDSEIVALFLLEKYEQLATIQVNSLRSLDGKATAQIGFAGTAVALFAAIGPKETSANWWQFAALGALILSIICCILSLRTRAWSTPTLDYYMPYEILNDPANKGKIAAELSGAWCDYAKDVQEIASDKAKWLDLASIVFVMGLILLVVGFIKK